MIRTFLYAIAKRVASRLLPSSIAPVSVQLARKERKLIAAAIDPNAHELSRRNAVLGLVEYLRSDEFKMQPGHRYQVSSGGYVFLESDIFGPEVRLMDVSAELLDCHPRTYHLSREQARAIYDAICEKAYL